MILFYILILIMPLTQHPLWSRTLGAMTVFKYVGAACLLYAVLRIATMRKFPPFLATRAAQAFLALYLLATFSYFTRGAPVPWGLNPLFSYTCFLGLLFITLAVVDTVYRLRIAMLAAIGSIGLASLYVIREWQKFHGVYANFRPGWVVGDANYFTVSAVLCLPLTFCLLRERRAAAERGFYVVCLALTVAAVTLAASRGGFLGLVAGFLFVAVRSHRRVKNVAIVLLLLLPVALVAPSSPLDRLLKPNAGDTESADNRTLLWRAGWQMIQAHPLAGIGLGNFRDQSELYGQPGRTPKAISHNTYIEMAAEMGLPAALTFIALLFFTYRLLERVRRNPDASSLIRAYAQGFQAGLVGYAVVTLFISAQYQKLFWLMVFTSIVLAGFSERSQARASVPAAAKTVRRKQPALASVAGAAWSRT